MKSEVHNIDCLEFMRGLPDKSFDLAIADPPYRDETENAPQKEMRQNGSMRTFGNKPTTEFFNELERISKAQIIWGANNFGFPFKGFIAWDKAVRGSDRYSQVEIASLSENIGKTSRYIQIYSVGKEKIHPTQKPIALYAWILENYGGGKKTIFDPMMGSQSSRIACWKMGFDFVGCELDKEYFEKGCERFNRECKGEIKTKDGNIIKQLSLF